MATEQIAAELHELRSRWGKVWWVDVSAERRTGWQAKRVGSPAMNGLYGAVVSAHAATPSALDDLLDSLALLDQGTFRQHGMFAWHPAQARRRALELQSTADPPPTTADSHVGTAARPITREDYQAINALGATWPSWETAVVAELHPCQAQRWRPIDLDGLVAACHLVRADSPDILAALLEHIARLERFVNGKHGQHPNSAAPR